jgi:peptidoglycan/LPS O-acetylase OafA/YrhL
MYYKSLQILRGFAALAVVLYHLGYYAEHLGLHPNGFFSHFGEHFSHGAWFFFVLSGFLMAFLIDTGYRNFLPRRLLRIYPTFLIAAVGITIARGMVFGSWSFGLNDLKALTLLPFGSSPTYPLGVEWTLVYEVFFYLVCAIFANRLLRGFFPYFLICWMLWLQIAFWGLNADRWFGQGDTLFLPSARHIFNSFMNELFVSGGLAYYVFKRLPALNIAWIIALLAVAAINYVATDPALAHNLLGAPPRYLWWMRHTPAHLTLRSFSFCLVVIACCMYERNAGKIARGMIAHRLEQFGDYSYALYLVHVPIITFILFAAKAMRGGQPVSDGVCCAALIAALVCGWKFGKVDVGLHQFFKRTLGRRKPAQLAPAGDIALAVSPAPGASS